MNNAYINKEFEESSDENLPIYREQVTALTELIEALQHIQASSYWKVLENMFAEELSKSKRQLEKESIPTEIYRLQGKISVGKLYDLADLLEKKKAELQRIKTKL